MSNYRCFGKRHEPPRLNGAQSRENLSVAYKTSLMAPAWTNLGASITAAGPTASATDTAITRLGTTFTELCDDALIMAFT